MIEAFTIPSNDMILNQVILQDEHIRINCSSDTGIQ